MAYYSDSEVLCDGCGHGRFGTDAGDGHYGTAFSWAPRWSMQWVACADCGNATDPMPNKAGWERPCDGLCAPHHSLGCGHSPRDPNYWEMPLKNGAGK